MEPNAVFRRPNLADQLARQVLSAGQSSSSSGVFVSAPRRTGKSTFLREDLRPALEVMGAYVLYVDLWSDKRADPGDLIVNVVRTALSTFDGVVTRLAKKGFRSGGVGPLTFSLDSVGLGTQFTLTDALAELSDELSQPIVLIIDEAQHAITSDKGNDALFALKAARDELNSTSHFGLRVVATGSNRDKLAMLRNSKDQAFFGAPLIEFPTLDLRFIDWFCARATLAAPLNPGMVWELFVRASYRPEILGSAADQLRFAFDTNPSDIDAQFAEAVNAQIIEAETQTLRVINSLSPLQSAVLRVMASRMQEYSPFTSVTMEAYQAVIGSIAPKDPIRADTSNVQQSLTALQEKALVWRERRGVYALEEQATAELLERHGLLAVVPPPTATD